MVHRARIQRTVAAPLARAACGLAALLLSNLAGAASQATAQGVIWGSTGSQSVFVNELDTGNPAASVSHFLVQDGVTFDFYASASLATGALKVRNVVYTGPGGGSATAQSGSAVPTTYARLQEELTFTPADNDPYTVTLSMQVGGLYELDPSSTGWANAQLNLGVSGGANDFDQVDILPGNFVISEFLSVSLTLQGVVTASLFAQLGSDIYAISGPDAYSGFLFGNSAYLALALPDSVSVSSGSGVFLSTPVPLPPGLPLLAVGLAGLALVARGRPLQV